MACDFRIATQSSRIGLPEVKVGLIPGGGGTQRLTKLVGTGRAMHMILSGKLYPAKEAVEQGLIHLCVPDGELASACKTFLAPVLKNPQHALSQAKLAVKASQNNEFGRGLTIETTAFQHCFEQPFFRQLMCRQLEEGILETTVDLPAGLCSQKKEER